MSASEAIHLCRSRKEWIASSHCSSQRRTQARQRKTSPAIIPAYVSTSPMVSIGARLLAE
jgi:hypothetical protein